MKKIFLKLYIVAYDRIIFILCKLIFHLYDIFPRVVKTYWIIPLKYFLSILRLLEFLKLPIIYVEYNTVCPRSSYPFYIVT